MARAMRELRVRARTGKRPSGGARIAAARHGAASGELARARAEIAALRRQLDELRHSASLDPLTRIGNRRMLDEALPREMRAAAGSEAPLCLALADIDRFKALNDSAGHAAGDGALRLFARTLRQNLKGRDVAVRFGGDEFALLLPRTPLAAARTLLDQIRTAFTEAMAGEAQLCAHPVTVSFGLAEHDGAESAHQLIRRADTLLYLAKAAGRDRVFQ